MAVNGGSEAKGGAEGKFGLGVLSFCRRLGGVIRWGFYESSPAEDGERFRT
jgi:hypothetical protein